MSVAAAGAALAVVVVVVVCGSVSGLPNLMYLEEGVTSMSGGSRYISPCSDGPSRNPTTFAFRGNFQPRQCTIGPKQLPILYYNYSTLGPQTLF